MEVRWGEEVEAYICLMSKIVGDEVAWFGGHAVRTGLDKLAHGPRLVQRTWMVSWMWVEGGFLALET